MLSQGALASCMSVYINATMQPAAPAAIISAQMDADSRLAVCRPMMYANSDVAAAATTANSRTLRLVATCASVQHLISQQAGSNPAKDGLMYNRHAPQWACPARCTRAAPG